MRPPRPDPRVLLCSALLLPLLPAQNCANTSIAATALTDLGALSYQGFAGGLYGNGQNTPPAAHLATALAALPEVRPRDANGNPSPTGRIVLLSIGMSNTTQEFSTWQTLAGADPYRNLAVTLVDGAQGGQDAITIANPNASYWNVVDQRLSNAGVTAQQVQVVWLKQAIAGPSGGFPAAAMQLQGLLGQIARNLRARFPHCRLCFCSSRTYAGYATTQLNPEPYAYESGFAVQWLVAQQAAGDPQLNCDPLLGPVLAPWLGFGPYLWTNGTTGRNDGLVWTCADVQPDGTHPSPAGRAKVAQLLQDFFTADPLTAPWYVGGSGSAAALLPYGSGCPGGSGVPNLRGSSLPIVGNAGFRIGLENALPGTLAMLLFSTAPAAVPLAGPCVLHLDPLQGLPGSWGLVQTNGSRAVPLPVPADPGLVGLQLFLQWGVLDPAGTPLPGLPGLAASRAARLVVGW